MYQSSAPRRRERRPMLSLFGPKIPARRTAKACLGICRCFEFTFAFGGHGFMPYPALRLTYRGFFQFSLAQKWRGPDEVSGPLTNTGTAPSCRSANASMNDRAWIVCRIDLQQCVGYRAFGAVAHASRLG
jgi:hypothetical protein